MRQIFSLILLYFFIFPLGAQTTGQNTGAAVLAGFSYGGHLPAGDLQERFGGNLSPGLQIDYLTPKNWIVSFISSFQFGPTVKTDVLTNLRTDEGFIIANDRSVADIQLRARGFFVGGSIGKLIGLSAKNFRSGLRVDLGFGLLQHQIRIQQDPVRTVAPLSGDYRKGYDRLSNGPALRQFIGYQILSNDRRANLFAGFELIEGFTQSRRAFDFLTQQPDTQKRVDILYGFRLGLFLPFYFDTSGDEIFY